MEIGLDKEEKLYIEEFFKLNKEIKKNSLNIKDKYILIIEKNII